MFCGLTASDVFKCIWTGFVVSVSFFKLMIAAILPFSRSLINPAESFSTTFNAEIPFKPLYTLFAVSLVGSNATRTANLPLLPINPNTKIKMSGKTKLNMTADGLLKTPLRLALVMAIIAFSWLYGWGINYIEWQM
jgi:hypothetical protein